MFYKRCQWTRAQQHNQTVGVAVPPVSLSSRTQYTSRRCRKASHIRPRVHCQWQPVRNPRRRHRWDRGLLTPLAPRSLPCYRAALPDSTTSRMSFHVNVRLPNGTCPAIAFPGASTTLRDLKLAALREMGPTPDGCEDTFGLDGRGPGLLTNDDQTFGDAGINNEATVSVSRRCECRTRVTRPWL